MSLTLGFIAFFISIVIPGILFRRFFFFGEFSKQFNTKDPVLHSIFFSIVPGIVIQVISSVIYHFSLGFDSSFIDVFTIFRDITSDGSKETQSVTKDFFDNHFITFLLYSLGVFLLSSILGWATSRLIRFRKWDKKHKLFRFKNQWYYIFSGEVLNMKKMEEAHIVSYRNNKGKIQDTLITYADILVSVSEQNERKELYTGYVVDYDLRSDDITQLDKLYLIDTHRYKKKEIIFDGDGNEIIDTNDSNPSLSRNRLRVPGDIFILNARKIVNLNLTYVPSTKKKTEKEEKTQKLYKKIQLLYISTIILIILCHFFYQIIGLDKTIFSEYLAKTGFFGKLTIILFVNQLIAFAVPFEDKDKKLAYNFKNLGPRIVGLIIWGLLAYFFVIKSLL